MKILNKLKTIARTFVEPSYIFLLSFCSFLFLYSCKKSVDVKAPVTSINTDNVFNSDATAAAALTGIYTDISYKGYVGNAGFGSLSIISGLSSDELSLFSGSSDAFQIAYYQNSLISSMESYSYWNIAYPYIYSCNSAIEGLNKSNSLTPSVKKQLTGEAKFMRAFFYFYLVNLYGDVPLALSTDYKINSQLKRSTIDVVYKQIIEDLRDAQNLLSPNYLKADVASSTVERLRPTSWAATALLARAYIFHKEWANAEAEATKVIANSTMFNLGTLDNAFLKNSKEAIWQLQTVSSFWDTPDGFTFILTEDPWDYRPVYLSTNLLNAFEPNDNRKTQWVGSYTNGVDTWFFPYKYKVQTTSGSISEHLMMLRLAEQYLIRAEARTQLNNIGGAQADLNMIRTRAGLGGTTASSQSTLLAAILHERQVELFTEWGHRWLDLKRTGTVDAVMSTVTPSKGGNWNTTDQLYPIPQFEIQKNLNLVQNPGY